jgi:hypothetical protein
MVKTDPPLTLEELMREAWANCKDNGHGDYLKGLSLESAACDMVDGDFDIGNLSGTSEYPDDEALLAAIVKLLPGILAT